MQKTKKEIYIIDSSGKKVLLEQNAYVYEIIDKHNVLHRYYIPVTTYERFNYKITKKSDFTNLTGFVELIGVQCLIVNK